MKPSELISVTMISEDGGPFRLENGEYKALFTASLVADALESAMRVQQDNLLYHSDATSAQWSEWRNKISELRNT